MGNGDDKNLLFPLESSIYHTMDLHRSVNETAYRVAEKFQDREDVPVEVLLFAQQSSVVSCAEYAFLWAFITSSGCVTWLHQPLQSLVLVCNCHKCRAERKRSN